MMPSLRSVTHLCLVALGLVCLTVVLEEPRAEGQMFRNCCYYVTIRNCSGNGEVSHLCPDCTSPTPFCGERSCNIFGCNCDGCRKQKENTEIIGMATWITKHFRRR